MRQVVTALAGAGGSFVARAAVVRSCAILCGVQVIAFGYATGGTVGAAVVIANYFGKNLHAVLAARRS